MNQEVWSNIEEILQDVLDKPSLKIIEGMSAKDVDNWDSLNHLKIILSIETEFGVRFSTAEIANFECVGDLYKTLIEKI